MICFTDIVGSTELLSRVGDDAFDELRRSHFDLLVRQVEVHGGEIVKNLGDGVMLAFGSASDAVSAAVGMQRAVDVAARAAGADGLAIRVGIAAGDATHEDGDWFGAPVVEGSRLCAAAGSGQIVVSEVVRLLAGSRGGHEFRPLGPLELKGLPDPVAASEVVWIPTRAEVAAPLPGPLVAGAGDLPFSGRAAIVESLQHIWKSAQSGTTQIVMIAGEPGVGKTRLVSELARTAHAEGALVLLGRADEHVDAPYGPWREAMRSLVRSLPDDVIAEHLDDFGGEVSRLVPELARRVDDLSPPASTDPDTERLLLFEAVGGLLAATSKRVPVLLVLDDLHWSDRSTLQLLLHVLRSDRPIALLVLATYRDTDVDRAHPLASALADLRRLRHAERISLSGLDGDGIASLLEQAGGHDLDDEGRAFAATLWRETEGNPFFVGEVLRHLIESGGLVQVDGRWRPSATLDEAGLPEGVREVIGRRLADLPDDTNHTLGAASVLGREFDVGLLSAITDQSIDETLDALAAAEHARLIGEVAGRPGRFSFSHALVRATLIDELGTNRRVRLHRAAGLALEATGSASLGELAHHFGEAAIMGETERAVQYAREAAEQALELAALDDALVFIRRALQVAELGDVGDATLARLHLVLGRALDAVNDVEGMFAAQQRAYDLAMRGGDRETVTVAALDYGGPLGFVSFAPDRAVEQLRAALDGTDGGDSATRAAVMARLAQWLASCPGDEGARLAREAHAMAKRVGSVEVQQSAAAAVALTMRNIDRHAMLAFAEETLLLSAGTFSAATADASGLANEARLGLGDVAGFDGAMTFVSELFAASPLRNLSNTREDFEGAVAITRTTLALIAGRFEEVDAIVADLRDERATRIGKRYVIEFAPTQLAYFRGNWAESSAGWERTCALIPGALDRYFGFGGVGWSLPALRDYWEQWWAEAPNRPEITKPSNVGVVAEALRRLDEREISTSYGEQFANQSGFFGTNTPLYFFGPHDRALGILFTTAGQLDRAVRHLRRAVDQCDAIDSPSWGTIARLELATTLRLRDAPGDLDESQRWAKSAHEMGSNIGMHGWVDRIEQLQAGNLEWWRLPGDRS